MDVVIENCRSIDHASISIEPNRLNVKFAPNGTGKSSTAKAIVAAINGSDTSGLIPFKWRQNESSGEHPFRVVGLESIATVEAFDENYVQSVVFQQDNLFPGSFDVFVRTPDFLKTESDLKDQLHALVELADRDEIRKLTTELNSFLSSLIGNSGLDRHNMPKASSPAVKALREGNTWEHEDPLLAPFKPMLGVGPFKKWAAWHKQGEEYLPRMEGVCPYCGQSISDVRPRIDAVGNSFDSSKAGNIEKVIEAVSVGSSYMSETATDRLNSIVDSAEPITEQAKAFVGKVAQDAQLIVSTLDKLRTTASFFDLSKADDLSARLENCKINIELIDTFDSAVCREIANEINDAVEAAKCNIGILKGLVNRQKDVLARSLKDKCKEINAFLATAGYPYSVNISSQDDDKCSVKLMHSCSWEVSDSREALSYGERNAFALVFFAYECKRRNPDLIILDDPISSFDGSKRYALLNMLFLGGAGEATLKGKTVLLLTHDYGTLFDIEHTHKPAFQPSAKSCVLSCNKGEVSEITVEACDMVLADALYGDLAKKSSSLITRLVYARRVLEIREDKGDAYNVVSSLFHHRPVPTLQDGTLLDSASVSHGIAVLESIVGEKVDYSLLFDIVENPTEMLALFDEPHSNYEKLQLARIATQGKTDDKVLKERMDDSVHVGNGFLYQLDPTKFELVPTELVERCREELVKLTDVEQG